MAKQVQIKTRTINELYSLGLLKKEVAKTKDIQLSEEERQQAVERNRMGVFSGLQQTEQSLIAPSEQIERGIAKLQKNLLAGAGEIGLGIVNTAFTMTGIPTLFGVLSDVSRKMGATNLADTFDGVMALPSSAVSEGTKQIDKGLEFIGLGKEKQFELIKKFAEIGIASGRPEARLLAPLLTEEGQQELASVIDETNKLGATLGFFHGINKGAKAIKKKVGVTKEVAWAQDNLKGRAGDKSFETSFENRQIEQGKYFVDEVGNVRDKQGAMINPKVSKTILEQQDIKTQRLGLVNEVKELKGQQGKEVSVRRKEIIKEISELDKRNNEIENELKGTEIYAKPLEKPVEQPKDISKDQEIFNKPQTGITQEQFENLEQPKLKIEERTKKNGQKYYYNTETKKITSKQKFEEENATQKGQEPESNIGEYPRVDEGGIQAETSRSNFDVESGKAQVTDVPLKTEQIIPLKTFYEKIDAVNNPLDVEAISELKTKIGDNPTSETLTNLAYELGAKLEEYDNRGISFTNNDYYKAHIQHNLITDALYTKEKSISPLKSNLQIDVPLKTEPTLKESVQTSPISEQQKKQYTEQDYTKVNEEHDNLLQQLREKKITKEVFDKRIKAILKQKEEVAKNVYPLTIKVKPNTDLLGFETGGNKATIFYPKGIQEQSLFFDTVNGRLTPNELGKKVGVQITDNSFNIAIKPTTDNIKLVKNALEQNGYKVEIDKPTKKSSSISEPAKPVEEQLIKNPINEIPKPIGDKIQNTAKDLIDEVSSASIEKSGAFRTSESTSLGEVKTKIGNSTINTFPEWFSQLGKSKTEILKGLQKILEDAGKDKGKLVEDLKAVILDRLQGNHNDIMRVGSAGKFETKNFGKIPGDTEITDFINNVKDNITLDKLHEEYKSFEDQTSFNFGANVKPQESLFSGKDNAPVFRTDKGMYDKGQGKGAEGTPLFEQAKTDKGQLELGEKPTTFGATLIPTDINFKDMKSNFLENSQVIKDVVAHGAKLIYEGAKDFKNWSVKMLENFGEAIKPHLLRIWAKVREFGGEIKTEFAKQIMGYAEKKGLINFAVEPKSFAEKIQQTTKKEFDVIAEEYASEYKRRGSLVTRTTERTIDFIGDTKRSIKHSLEAMSTSALKISPEFYQKLRKFKFEKGLRHIKVDEVTKEYLTAKKKAKLTLEEQARFDAALDNPKFFEEAEKMAKARGFYNEFKKAMDIKDLPAKELEVELQKNHFPRMVKDYNGFREYLFEKFPEYKTIIEKMISDKEAKSGKMTTEQQMTYVNNALRGYNPKISGIALSDLGNMKKRVIPVLDGEFKKFYATNDEALVKFNRQMNDLAMERKFFGKNGFDLDESIGNFITDLEKTGKIAGKDVREVKEILRAVFNERGITNKFVKALRDIGIITKLGNPLAMLTQVKDLGFSIALSPKDFPKGLSTSISHKLGGEKGWSLKEVGYDPEMLIHELSDYAGRQRFVDTMLKVNQFTNMDFIGKDTRINTTYYKFKKWAEKSPDNPEFNRRIENYFGKGEEKTKVIADLKSGKKTDSIAFLLFNELSNVQPITLLELPKNYATGGNARAFYFLKTFGVRQLDYVLNESIRVMTNDKLPTNQRAQGLKNLLQISTALVLVGASVDQVKSKLIELISGTEQKDSFGDDVVDNLMNIALLSRYDYSTFSRNAEEAVANKILPPYDMYTDPIVDVANLISGKDRALRSTKQIPIIGRFLYEGLKDKPKSSGTLRKFNQRQIIRRK